jgi:thiosulfate reductase cytochrome b subunit
MADNVPGAARPAGHPGWVRVSHWSIAAAVLTLAFSGFVILKAHPRLYWGNVGNDLTPAFVELPVSRNYRHGGWTTPAPFYPDAGSPVSAARTFDIYNENGWARSLHFLVAWFVVVPGLAYLAIALLTGHVRRHLLPSRGELTRGNVGRDVAQHLRLPMRRAAGGPPYGVLQKISYSFVVLIVLPLIVLTGLTLSPAVSAALPTLPALFGGVQSARTLHFLGFSAIVLFVLVHLAMVLLTGFRQQIRAMTIGSTR